MKQYWFDPDTYRRGNIAIPIDMQPQRSLWIDTLAQVQKEMLDEVTAKELVVEVNPSSNRMVGQLSSYADHPIFRMVTDEGGHLSSRVRLTVNTDDPGIFCTSLAHEYYLLGEILISAGICEPDVVSWLDTLRRNSADYSFLRCLPTHEDENMSKLLTKLKKINKNLLNKMLGKSPQPIAFQKKMKHQFSEGELEIVRRLLSNPVVRRLLREEQSSAVS